LQNPALAAGQRLAANLQHARAAGQPLQPVLAATGQSLLQAVGQPVGSQAAYAQQAVGQAAPGQQAVNQAAPSQPESSQALLGQDYFDEATHNEQAAGQAAQYAPTAGYSLRPQYGQRHAVPSGQQSHSEQAEAAASFLRNVIEIL